MMRLKGRLVAKRNIRCLTPKERADRAKQRVVDKLGKTEFDRIVKQYSTLNSLKTRKSQFLIDGMIMGLIQQNLANREIRQVFKVGNDRINRIRRVIKNPELLRKKPFVPKHAATPSDIERIKTHLELFDTEDGFPCAHRRALKFFLKQGLT